jgi:hypothetical protein
LARRSWPRLKSGCCCRRIHRRSLSAQRVVGTTISKTATFNASGPKQSGPCPQAGRGRKAGST